jgi:hypothetical protein
MSCASVFFINDWGWEWLLWCWIWTPVARVEYSYKVDDAKTITPTKTNTSILHNKYILILRMSTTLTPWKLLHVGFYHLPSNFLSLNNFYIHPSVWKFESSVICHLQPIESNNMTKSPPSTLGWQVLVTQYRNFHSRKAWFKWSYSKAIFMPKCMVIHIFMNSYCK